ncbi:MAG: DUF3343 domain-containing protein [Chloroflexi bacterium]|nr:MAG: DUF3343 domain-containing protein [Chloroflexota bacterium]
MTGHRYTVILVHSTSHAIRAEKALYQAEISTKLIPVPRHISSDCGVCVRVERADQKAAVETLKRIGLEVEGVHEA